MNIDRFSEWGLSRSGSLRPVTPIKDTEVHKPVKFRIGTSEFKCGCVEHVVKLFLLMEWGGKERIKTERRFCLSGLLHIGRQLYMERTGTGCQLCKQILLSMRVYAEQHRDCRGLKPKERVRSLDRTCVTQEDVLRIAGVINKRLDALRKLETPPRKPPRRKKAKSA